MKKRIFALVMALAMTLTMTMVLSGCGGGEEEQAEVESKGTITLATTTSTKDSGLLDEILPEFTKATGWEVDVVSVGSGEAMEMGMNGEADVLLVHSPAAEKEYVDGGHADEDGRMDVMYNDFVVIGPESDPAAIGENAADDAVAAFTAIMDKQSTFVSRADDSGTHKKELSIWEKASLTPSGEWYVEAAAGMGDVITMTDEMTGYTLSDRATWLNVGKNTALKILCEKDPSGVLNNQYGVICVNPEKNENIKHDGAKAFQEWIVSEDTQKLIGEYGVEEYGQALFVPNANADAK